METWKKVNRSGCYASSYGRWKQRNGTIVDRPSTWLGGKRRNRIFYELFIGAIPDGMVVHHIDGDIQNFAVDNLCLGKEYPKNSKRVIDNRTGKVYASCYECACDFDVDTHTIARYCNGDHKGWLDLDLSWGGE